MNKKREILICFLFAISSIVIVSGIENYLVSLYRSLAIQIAAFMIFATVYFMFKRKIKIAIIGFLSSVTILLFLPSFHTTENENPINNNEIFRVAQFNVLRTNRDHTSTINAAINSDADFISFQEVNSKWADSLIKGLESRYPYRLVKTVDDRFCGIAVFSRFPLSNIHIIDYGVTPNIVGKIEVEDGNSINFIAAHPQSPTRYFKYRIRNKHFRQMASYLENIDDPVIALGDFNAVPWDKNIMEFKRKTKMLDSRKSYVPTWPNLFNIGMIPIDYIFHSNEIACLDFKSIRGTSSDHFGIVGEYRVN
ncbi:MAG: endonuclease/exonuclease/phosphatase family protein [Saprospiraceae bacterium]|nr:endonuclease/exonuclease/phosphatase family protein [Saprospiraceae bacterium]